MHEKLKPERYLEIGAQSGKTLRLADGCVSAVGVDPAPAMAEEAAFLRIPFVVERINSDGFFRLRASARYASVGIDLTFIDGLHVFEYALRDFVGCEWVFKKDGRNRGEDRIADWPGDVWRLVLVFGRFQPDLRITILDVQPAGMALVENLDPGIAC